MRELALRIFSVQSVLGPIQRLLKEQPDPDVVAKSLVGNAVTR